MEGSNLKSYLPRQYPVSSLQLVDSVPADKQTGEEGIAVDAVVAPGEGDDQKDGEQQDHHSHLGSNQSVYTRGPRSGLIFTMMPTPASYDIKTQHGALSLWYKRAGVSNIMTPPIIIDSFTYQNMIIWELSDVRRWW